MKVELSNPIFFFRNLVWLNNKVELKQLNIFFLHKSVLQFLEGI